MFLEKTKSSLVAVILIILSLGLAVPTMSVNASTTETTLQKKFYDVKPGDNLWNLSKKLYGDHNKWRKLADDNGLSKKVFKGPQGPYTKEQEYCPLDTSLFLVYYTFVDTGAAGLISPIPHKNSKVNWKQLLMNDFMWIPILFLIIIALLVAWLLDKRRIKREADPVGSGQPQVKGGVDEAHALQRVQNIANANGINPLRVTNIQKGRFYGRARVYYADKPLGLMKRFDGEDGYRGIVLRTNGEEQTVYFLQGCGNDVRQGNFMTGIRFVADDVQPESFITYNQGNQISIQQQEGIKDEAGDQQQPEPFNWQKEYVQIIKDSIKAKQPIFFDVKIGTNTVRFDSLNNPNKTEKKPSNAKSDRANS